MNDDLLGAKFSLVRGGPAHALQRRLGMLGADDLPSPRAALALALVAWLPPGLLELIEREIWSLTYASNFFTDAGSYARYLIAIFVLTLMDRSAHRRVNRLLGSFLHAGMIAEDDRAAFDRALSRADQQTASAGAEAVMVVSAYALAIIALSLGKTIDADLWFKGDLAGVSAAGWWALLVSTPLYFFLALRWVWRFLVWARLLGAISRLRLRLVPTHPDRAGGLGFLTLFPMIFLPLTFALSMVIASSALQELLFDEMTLGTLQGLTVLWLAFVSILFIAPLCVVSGKLLMLREAALLQHGDLVARYHRRTLEALYRDESEGAISDLEAISALADTAPAIDTLRSIRLIPLELWALIPLAVTAAGPLLAVASVEVPLGSLLTRLLGVLL